MKYSSVYILILNSALWAGLSHVCGWWLVYILNMFVLEMWFSDSCDRMSHIYSNVLLYIGSYVCTLKLLLKTDLSYLYCVWSVLTTNISNKPLCSAGITLTLLKNSEQIYLADKVQYIYIQKIRFIISAGRSQLRNHKDRWVLRTTLESIYRSKNVIISIVSILWDRGMNKDISSIYHIDSLVSITVHGSYCKMCHSSDRDWQ